jgi:uncharacterized protein
MRDLSDTEVARLQELLDDLVVATPVLAPLDVSALDGYLCGVLLQPQPVSEPDWLPHVWDAEGRPLPPRAASLTPPLLALVRRRHAALDEAIAQRRWFDPWIFELATSGRQAPTGAATPADAIDGDVVSPCSESVLPWVAGFALAIDRFPALMRFDAQALAEPLALLYQHFDPDDLEGLEDEPALAAALAEADPPADLAEAAEDLVRAVLLLADVSRPRPQPSMLRTAPSHASPAPGPRSKSARPARARRG